MSKLRAYNQPELDLLAAMRTQPIAKITRGGRLEWPEGWTPRFVESLEFYGIAERNQQGRLAITARGEKMLDEDAQARADLGREG